MDKKPIPLLCQPDEFIHTESDTLPSCELFLVLPSELFFEDFVRVKGYLPSTTNFASSELHIYLSLLLLFTIFKLTGTKYICSTGYPNSVLFLCTSNQSNNPAG